MPNSNHNGIKKMKYDNQFSKQSEKHTYRWILHNFSELLKTYAMGMSFISPIFGKKGSKYQWQIKCYPNGDVKKDYISIYVNQIAMFDVFVKSTIDAKNSDDEILIHRTFEQMFEKFSQSWGYTLFMKHGDIKVLDDILIIKIDVTTSFEEYVSGAKVVQDLEIAWNNKLVTDVVLKTGDFELPVHKFILCARSPVFAANFQHDTVENAKGMIQIDDVDKETLVLVVEFIYTGKVSELSYDKAKRLLCAADKYNLTDLIEICENYLIDEIQLSNIVDIVLLADLYNATTLKTNAIAFMMENHWKFANNTSLSIVAEKSPKLLLDITAKLFSNQPSETKMHT